MINRSLRAVVFLAALTSAAFAQQQPQPSANLQLPPTPLLPAELAGWKSADAAATLPPLSDDLSDTIKKEFILQREASHGYQDGNNFIQIRAEQFVDATGSYAAFTLLRKPDMRPTAQKIGDDSIANANTLLFWFGPTFVEVSGPHNDLKPLQDLIVHLPRLSGSKGEIPLLVTHYPKDGLRADTLRYAVGPASYEAQGGTLPASLLDFAKAPEISTANYSNGGVLTLIYYPTPAIAGDRSRALLAYLTSHPPAGTAVDSILVKRTGPIVAITTGKFTPPQAKSMLDKVKYDMNVTWNKPELYISEASKAAKLVVGIIMGTFAIAIAALVLGVFFGGGRALIRVLRGKPASVMHDNDFVHLDLTGAPAPPRKSEPDTVQSEG